MGATVRRLGVSVTAFALVAAALFTVPLQAGAEPEFPRKRCGSFVTQMEGHPAYRVTVFHAHISCRVATGVIRDFWEGKRVDHGEAAGGGERWNSSIKGRPGWWCVSGLSSGICHRKRHVAGYRMAAL